MLKNLCANFGVKIAIFCLVHAEHRSLFQTSKSPDPPIAFFSYSYARSFRLQGSRFFANAHHTLTSKLMPSPPPP